VEGTETVPAPLGEIEGDGIGVGVGVGVIVETSIGVGIGVGVSVGLGLCPNASNAIRNVMRVNPAAR
jgi:hypothetical protein